MRQDRRVSGITIGIVAASATSGALLGFGIRLGAPAWAFNAVGAILLGPGAQEATGFLPGATLLGLGLHVVAMLGVGLLYAAIVSRSAGHSVAWAGIVSAGVLAGTLAVARLFGVGLGALLPAASVVAFCILLALSLAVGMRLALSKV